MDVIRGDVRKLVNKELNAANKRFRPFASPHEGQGIVREELEEVEQALMPLEVHIKKRMWNAVKANETISQEELHEIREMAVHLAVEAIQVAAMVKSLSTASTAVGLVERRTRMAQKRKSPPAEVENVTITMSRKTAEAVKQACEEYLRLRMGQFEDFTNEVCCWDYVEQMEKECHTTEERKKFNRDHEQDFYKCMRLRDRMRAGLRALWTQNVPTASIQFTLREAYRAESVWLAIRYALAWHDFPEGGMWNDFFSPLNRSDQPMPKVELKEKAGTE